MRPATRTPVRRALVASVATGLSGQAALIISGVVVARVLGVQSRGDLALLAVLPLILGQLGGLGLPLATTFEIARDPAVARPLLRQIRRFVGVQTLGLTLLHAAMLAALVAGRPGEVQLAAAFTLVALPAFIALQHGLAVLQGLQRHLEFNVLRLAPVLLYGGLAVVVFVGGGGTLPLFAGGYAASTVVIGAVTLALAVHLAPSREAGAGAAAPALPATRRLIGFGVRTVLGSTSPSDGSGIDQAAVGLFLSTHALGLYVVAAAFMNLSRLVTQSIGLVAYPQVARRRDPGDADRAMWRFAAVGAVAALAIIAILELSVGYLITLFFGRSYAGATDTARLLLVAALFLGARRVLSDAARGANRQLAGTVAEIASWAVLIPALVVLAPLWGIRGVGLAVAAAAAAGLGAIVREVRRPPQADRPPALADTPPLDVALEARDLV